MSDNAKQMSPPYATFTSLIGFINKLRDTVVPSRIDPSVFGNASGSISYSIIASLKFLKLIDDAGTPTQQFIALVKATDEARPAMLKVIIEKGYASLFASDVNLETMTSGQFDEHMRTVYGAQGSTVDKIAAFFIAACKMAGIPLSAHLMARKAVATSSTSKKSAKQRKRDDDEDFDDPPPPPPPATAQNLGQQLLGALDMEKMDETEVEAVWTLLKYLRKEGK